MVHNAKFCGTDATDAGKLGEARAGIDKNTDVYEINGRNRIPDEVTDTMITEVKNVKTQSLSIQIKDDLDLAKNLNTDFTLITRENTHITKPLQAKIDEGLIIHNPFLPPVN